MTPRALALADHLKLPADEAVTQKYGFIGRSGSGKSYAAMRLAELFLQHDAQVIALDWVGIWWSLRLAHNGRDAGFKDVYIFGGEHGDLDLRPESGALMADLVVDKHISVVLDVMHFRKAERTRFATAFAEQFFHRKKTARTACHLFIEEAQAYLPQMVRGEEARMVGVFEDIGKVGRNYGIGNSLISQRPQAINKDVLNQIEVLLAFQTNGPQERKAIAGWTAENTDAGATMMQELPKLDVGHALVWSPQWLRIAEQVHISERITYDASSTPTQKAKSIKPKTLDQADLAELGEQMQATIEKGNEENPAILRSRIAKLKAEAHSITVELERARQQKSAGREKRVEVPVVTDAQIKRLEKLVQTADAVVNDFHERVAEFSQAFGKVVHASLPPANPTQGPGSGGRPVDRPRRPAPRVVTPAEGISGVEQRILNALAELELLGQSQPAREIVAFLAHYTNLNSKGFVNAIGGLRSKELIDYPSSGAIMLTEAGRGVARYPDAPRSSKEVQDRVVALLGGASARILYPLIDAYPKALPREVVAEKANYGNLNSKGFANAIGRLRTLGFIDYPERGSIRANDVLFLDGAAL